MDRKWGKVWAVVAHKFMNVCRRSFWLLIPHPLQICKHAFYSFSGLNKTNFDHPFIVIFTFLKFVIDLFSLLRLEPKNAKQIQFFYLKCISSFISSHINWISKYKTNSVFFKKKNFFSILFLDLSFHPLVVAQNKYKFNYKCKRSWGG